MKTYAAMLVLVTFMSAYAATPEVIQTDWQGLQQQVIARGLSGRKVEVTLRQDNKVGAKLLGITDRGLTLSGKQSSIARDEVRSVRFRGRLGSKGRVIGTVAGLGGGAAIGAGIIAGADVSEGPAIIVIPVTAVAIAAAAGLVGYYVGRGFDPPAPEFVITR